MLKTIVLAATSLVMAMGVALASGQDWNNDGKVEAWEVHQFFSQDGGEHRR